MIAQRSKAPQSHVSTAIERGVTGNQKCCLKRVSCAIVESDTSRKGDPSSGCALCRDDGAARIRLDLRHPDWSEAEGRDPFSRSGYVVNVVHCVLANATQSLMEMFRRIQKGPSPAAAPPVGLTRCALVRHCCYSTFFPLGEKVAARSEVR